MAVTFILGTLETISANFINPYTGELIEVKGDYYVNDTYVNGGPAADDILLSSTQNQFFSLEDALGNLLFEDFEQIILNAGDDILNLSSKTHVLGDMFIQMDDGNDFVLSNVGNDIIHGNNGNDILYGGAGNDILDGGNDDDLLAGSAGNDTLVGGEGVDTALFTGNQEDYDIVFNGDGSITISDTALDRDDVDTLFGIEFVQFANSFVEATEEGLILPDPEEGIVLHGGRGSDKLVGGEGNDELYGGNGSDILIGKAGDDLLYGENGSDWFYGGSGNDVLDGGRGSDKMRAGSGDDLLLGGHGKDLMSGGEGNDTLNGGYGRDMLHGGSGADTFVFDSESAHQGIDLILDFSIREGDALDISDLLSMYDPLEDALSDFVQITQHRCFGSVLSVDVDGGGDGFVKIAAMYGLYNLTDVDVLQELGAIVTS